MHLYLRGAFTTTVYTPKTHKTLSCSHHKHEHTHTCTRQYKLPRGTGSASEGTPESSSTPLATPSNRAPAQAAALKRARNVLSSSGSHHHHIAYIHSLTHRHRPVIVARNNISIRFPHPANTSKRTRVSSVTANSEAETAAPACGQWIIDIIDQL